MSKKKVINEAKILFKEKNLTFNQAINFVYQLAHREGFIKGTNKQLAKILREKI